MVNIRHAIDLWWSSYDAPLYLKELLEEEWDMVEAFVDATEIFFGSLHQACW